MICRKFRKKILVLLIFMMSVTVFEGLALADGVSAGSRKGLAQSVKASIKRQARSKIPYVTTTGRGSVKLYLRRQIAKRYRYSGYTLFRSYRKNGRYKAVKRFSNCRRVMYDRRPKIGKKVWYKVSPYWSVNGKRIYSRSSAPVKTVNRLRIRKSMRVKAYAYTGHTITAIGKRAKRGRIAVDPRVIRLRTYVWVSGYGLAQACDTGGDIKGKTVDLFMNTERECRRWGIRYTRLHILG